MAVTKIWPVKGRLDAVIRYAGNEEKTRLPDLTGLSAGKDDLSDVLQYAANDAKPVHRRTQGGPLPRPSYSLLRQSRKCIVQSFTKHNNTQIICVCQVLLPSCLGRPAALE